LDFRKAFDTVSIPILLQIAKAEGFDLKTVQLIEDMYRNKKACVGFGDIRSESFFDVKRGVAQGDPLSPTLFNIFIDQLLRRLKQSGIGIQITDQLINAIAYADDIVLMASSAKDLQKLIDICQKWCTKFGMAANVSKCATMETNRRSTRYMTTHRWGSAVLPKVDKYKYLGVVLQKNMIFDNQTSKNISKATNTEYTLRKTLRNPLINPKWRATIIKCYIIPALLNGFTVFPLDRAADKLSKCYRRIIRRTFGLSRGASTAPILEELGLPTIRRQSAYLKLLTASRWGAKFPQCSLTRRIYENSNPDLTHSFAHQIHILEEKIECKVNEFPSMFGIGASSKTKHKDCLINCSRLEDRPVNSRTSLWHDVRQDNSLDVWDTQDNVCSQNFMKIMCGDIPLRAYHKYNSKDGLGHCPTCNEPETMVTKTVERLEPGPHDTAMERCNFVEGTEGSIV